MSVLFPRARIAAACAGILFLIIYVPYMFLATLDSAGKHVPTAAKIFVVSTVNEYKESNSTRVLQSV